MNTFIYLVAVVVVVVTLVFAIAAYAENAMKGK